MPKIKIENTEVEIIHFQQTYSAKILTEIVAENKDIVANCQAISFLNSGDVDCRLLDIPLQAGSPMLAFNGEIESLDTTKYRIFFDPQTTGTKPEIIVIRRYLSKIQWQE